MLVLDRPTVRELLDVEALVDALATAMADLTTGRASVPPRVGASVDERDGMLLAMPGHVPSLGALAAKLVSLFPRNAGTALPTHQALIAAFDPETGEPLALLDGTEITAARTAAGSALATRLLAREDAAVAAILGTGVQAEAHARALVHVRPLRELRIAGRDPERAEALARRLRAELDLDVRAAAGHAEACRGADVVCAATHTHEPVVHRAALEPGAHVTSVGFDPAGREVDDATMRDALVCVESRAAVLAPHPAGSTDVLAPVAAGLLAEDDLVEVGELVLGRHPGRTSDDQITVYKSVGVAVQDAAAAALVLTAARERGAGIELVL